MAYLEGVFSVFNKPSIHGLGEAGYSNDSSVLNYPMGIIATLNEVTVYILFLSLQFMESVIVNVINKDVQSEFLHGC